MGACSKGILSISNAVQLEDVPELEAHMGGIMGDWMLMNSEMGNILE
jgi:hypothetical protein